MSEIRKVVVENMVNHKVGLNIENGDFKRKFQSEGSKLTVPFEVLYDGLSEFGVSELFRRGFLRVVNKQDRIDLGLESDGAAEEAIQTLTNGEILLLLKVKSVEDLEKKLLSLPEAQQLKVATAAVENKITDFEKCTVIKTLTGVDVFKQVNSKIQAEEADEVKNEKK